MTDELKKLKKEPRYLKRLEAVKNGGDKEGRTPEEILADLQGLTLEQYLGLESIMREPQIKTFQSDISTIKIKLRGEGLKLITERVRVSWAKRKKTRYSIANIDAPEKIVKQFIREKKRPVRAFEHLMEDVDIIEKSKLLSEQELLPFKIGNSTISQLLLEEANSKNKERKRIETKEIESK